MCLFSVRCLEYVCDSFCANTLTCACPLYTGALLSLPILGFYAHQCIIQYVSIQFTVFGQCKTLLQPYEAEWPKGE